MIGWLWEIVVSDLFYIIVGGGNFGEESYKILTEIAYAFAIVLIVVFIHMVMKDCAEVADKKEEERLKNVKSRRMQAAAERSLNR